MKLQTSKNLCIELSVKVEVAKGQLYRAEKLVESLAHENGRWNTTFDNLSENLNNLTGNLFLSAAFLSYLGPFT